VRQFGFRVFRVRYQAEETGKRPGAKVQISGEEHEKIPRVRQTLLAALSASGFGRVEIDPEPLKR